MDITFLEDEIKNKVVIITGGNKGIGRGCARAFCKYHANVVIAARDEAAGTKAAAELSGESGANCIFYKCDVSKPQEVEALVEFTYSTFGRIDCIVNNAGYLPQRNPIDLLTEEDFYSVLKTNLVGMFSGCKYAMPYLRQSKGSIINMSSVLAKTGQEGSCMYSATKGAIVSLTKSLACDEARNGVRINALLPGDIVSEIGKGEENNTKYRLENNMYDENLQWIQRVGEPEEIGTICVFLSSSWAGYITGAEISADGGFMLGNGYKTPMFDWSNITNKNIGRKK